MKILHKQYSLISFILIVLILSSLHPAQGDSFLYYQEFDLTGNLLIIGQGRYNFNGMLRIDVSQIGEQDRSYNISYDANIPSYNEHGSALIKEDGESKLMDSPQSNGKDFILDFIWNIHSQEEKNELYSIFRISNSELEQNEFKILNYTVTSYTEASFFSPYLNYRIEAYKLHFNVNNNTFTLYFDTDNLVLIGFKSTFRTDDLGENGAIAEIIGTLSSTTLDLPRGNAPVWIIYLQAFIFLIILLPVLIFLYRRFLRKEIIMKGGLDNE